MANIPFANGIFTFSNEDGLEYIMFMQPDTLDVIWKKPFSSLAKGLSQLDLKGKSQEYLSSRYKTIICTSS
jgi:hypothetical protein